jgi:hypothetical protein
MSCPLRANGARFDVVTISADTLHKVATDRQTYGQSPHATLKQLT